MTLSLRFTVMLLAALFLGACASPSTLPSDEQRQEALGKVPCLVVLPVRPQLGDEAAADYNRAAELERGAAYMDTVLTAQLAGRSHVRVLSERQITSLIPEQGVLSGDLIDRVAGELKCNAVLVTSLERFSQRIGGDYGVDQPASVVFTMKLHDVRQGAVLWSAMFAETQQSLLSNLMSLKTATRRGLKWITAEEMAEQGIIDKIRECPYL
ncbi:MAG: hypothetical protein RBS34_11025 [Desulfofustis sp.]|jgi:hypothetical protein|nr:hypothetical protein [Desulfofustis sp.]